MYRRATAESQAEDEQLRDMMQILLLAQQSTNTRLERLEDQTLAEEMQETSPIISQSPNLDPDSHATTRKLRAGHRRNRSSRVIFDIAANTEISNVLSGSAQRTSTLLNTKIYQQADFGESQRRTWSCISDQRHSVTQSNELLQAWTDQNDPAPPYILSWHEDYGENGRMITNLPGTIKGEAGEKERDSDDILDDIPIATAPTSRTRKLHNAFAINTEVPGRPYAQKPPADRSSHSPAPTKPLPTALFGGNPQLQISYRHNAKLVEPSILSRENAVENAHATITPDALGSLLLHVIYGSSIMFVDIAPCKNAVEVHRKVVKTALYPAFGDVDIYGLWILDAEDSDPKYAQSFTDEDLSTMRSDPPASRGQLILRRNNHAIHYTLELEITALAQLKKIAEVPSTSQPPSILNFKTVASSRVRQVARVHRKPTRGIIEHLHQGSTTLVSIMSIADTSDREQTSIVENGLQAANKVSRALTSNEPVYVEAIYEYHAGDSAALNFSQGDIIQVIEVLESGWWHGVRNDSDGARGWFPSNYCKLIDSLHNENELEERENIPKNT